MMIKLWVVGALAAVFACQVKNPNYCPGSPDDNCTQGDAMGQACKSDNDCSAPAAICDTAGSKTCVQCIAPTQTSACMGTTPTCGDNHACRACVSHAECTTSAVCLPDGSCASMTDVAYAQMNGTGTACTKATPCGTLDDAVKANRPFVKITGLLRANGQTTIDGKNVTILGDVGAKLDRDGDGVILEVRSPGADVKIFDLEITGQTGGTDSAISVVPNGGAPKLTLTRSAVSVNQGTGISFAGGTLTIARSMIRNNQGGGINMTTAGVVDITNSFFHHNGSSTTSTFGAMVVRPGAGSKIEFNTIIDNASDFNSVSVGGVFCDVIGFVAANNIIFRNTGGPGAAKVQTFGSCTYGNSFIAEGTGATDNTPMFASPNLAPLDYRLTLQSPTTVRDAAGACTGIDFEGTARPSGPACDLGADEVAQ
jgi:hypothetical protein